MGQSKSSGSGHGPGLSASLKSLINFWKTVPLGGLCGTKLPFPDSLQNNLRTGGLEEAPDCAGQQDWLWAKRWAGGPGRRVHSPLGLGTSVQWNICAITANVMSTGNWRQLQLNYSLKDKKGPQRWPQKATGLTRPRWNWIGNGPCLISITKVPVFKGKSHSV